ncbi:MAVS protein, partial [Climacteris rufus]|nr:MAVS protein [Climacteris rufus]
MGLAEDKVYSHISRNLRKFGTIRVASLADSLTCLVDYDRDELHAREETRGNQAAVFRFYQHLRCRQGWVQDLIQALRHNNAGHLADELQEVYDTWQRRPRDFSCSLLMIHSSPPGPSAPSDAHPSASSISAQTPSQGPNPAAGVPMAEQPHRDVPVGDHPPVLPSAATTMRTDLGAKLPVQESLPKKPLEQESPRPIPAGSTGHDRVSAGQGAEGSLSHPPGTPGAAVPPEQGRDWLSRRPVCVDNGFFGNANHLHRGAPGVALGRAGPSRDAGVAHSPEQPGNVPEEDSDVSTESPLQLEGAPKSLPKQQPVPSPGRGEPTGSLVEVRSPRLIQEQFDVEKKRVGMQQRGSEDSLTKTTTLVAPPVPRDTFPSRDSSVKSLTQEKTLPVGNRASSTPSVPTKENVFPASANPLLGAAVGGGSEGTAGRSASRVSSATSIWAPCSSVEGDEELNKPGVLASGARGSPEVASRCPSSPPSTASNSLHLSSDPILLSSDSLRSGGAFPRVSSECLVRADSREKEAAGARRKSHPAGSWDSSSLGTHELRVDHYPSAQLGAGSDGAGPLGSSLNFSSGSGHAASSSPQAKVPTGDSSGPSLLYILPAVGIISAVAFVVYARLRK